VIFLKITNLVAGKGSIASLTLCYSLCKSEYVNIVSVTNYWSRYAILSSLSVELAGDNDQDK
jgi:hypothetical protein